MKSSEALGLALKAVRESVGYSYLKAGTFFNPPRSGDEIQAYEQGNIPDDQTYQVLLFIQNCVANLKTDVYQLTKTKDHQRLALKVTRKDLEEIVLTLKEY